MMPLARRLAQVLPWLMLPIAALHAQKPTALELAARLRTVSDQTALDEVARPFHLILDVSIAAIRGQPERRGTIEEWRAGDDHREVFTFPGGSATRLQHAGRYFHKETGDPIPDLADILLRAVGRPGPTDGMLNSTDPELRVQKFGKEVFQCIMLDRHIAERESTIPLPLFPTYCLNASGDFAFSLNAVGENVLRRSSGSFLDHDVTTNIVVSADGATAAEAKVTKLSTFTPRPTEFDATPDLIEDTPGATGVDADVVKAKKLGGKPPTYPPGARQDRVGGTVTLHTLIGRDGRIYSLEPMSAPRADLALAALAAVRTWYYSPYLVAGRPVEVDTTITVNFNIR